MSESSTPDFSHSARVPVTLPWAGSSGVDGTLSTVIRPVSSSTRIRSVNVPPTSTPIRFIVSSYDPVATVAGMISRPTVSICSKAPFRYAHEISSIPSS